MKLLIFTQKVDKDDQLLGFFIRWIEEFCIYYDEVVVFCLQKGNYDLPASVKVIDLGKDKYITYPFYNIFKKIGLFRLFFILKTNWFSWKYRKRYDHVFVHMNPEYMIAGSLMWKLLKKKLGLWYTHGHVGWQLKLAERMTDLVFTASDKSFRLKSDKKHVTGHGIDTKLFDSRDIQKDKKQFTIMSVGRISPVKNYEVLISAIDILMNTYGIDNMRVHIVGGIGDHDQKKYFDTLKNFIRDKGLSDVFDFVGVVTHEKVVQYLNSADLFVNMSNTGSIDKAVLEAMGCRLPVITSNDAFFPLLSDQSYDATFNFNDAEGFAKKINAMYLKGAEEREYIGFELRKIVNSNHSISNLIQDIQELYKK